MADEDEVAGDAEFEEEAELEEEVPEELDEDALEEDFEEEDPLLDEDDIADEEVEEEEDEAEEAASPRRRTTDEEDEDEDLLAPDDVEADLDTILKDRLVTAEESVDEDDEEAEVDERGGDGDRLQPKRPDEQLCQSCFLLVRRTAPGCPVGDDACPLFS